MSDLLPDEDGEIDPGPSGRDRKGIQSVEIGLRVLDALARAGAPLSLKAVAQGAGMSASKAHRYLVSFVRGGLVEQDPATGRYDLGGGALRLGLAALGRLDAVEVAAGALDALAEETGQTALLCVWGEGGPTIVRWRRGGAVITSLALGSVLPVLTSATGRVLLAHLPPAMTKARVTAELARAAAEGRPFPPGAVEAAIEETRRRGHAAVQGDVIPGLRAVAAPVLDHQGEAAAAITLLSSGPGPGPEAATAALMRAAAQASARLGWSGERPECPVDPRGA
jgi:DNA-binding IclR family transcriptional regulator